MDAGADGGPGGFAKPLIIVIEVALLPTLVLIPGLLLAGAPEPAPLVASISGLGEFAALTLAVCSLALIVGALGTFPGSLIPNPLAPAELGTTLLVCLGGAMPATGLARRSLFTSVGGGNAGRERQLRGAAVAVGVTFEQADALVRR